MAGGEGSRLRPLTSRASEAARAGRRQAGDGTTSSTCCGATASTEIVATLHYMADEIETYFGNGVGFRRRDALRRRGLAARDGGRRQEGRGTPRERAVHHHLRRRADRHRPERARSPTTGGRAAVATIALRRVTNPLEFGVVVTDEHGRITRFLEKPSWGEVFSDTINTGIYVLDPAIFEYMEARQVVRLLARPLPADAARRPPTVRRRHGRLLDRHREPATVPAGQLRRAAAATCGSRSPGKEVAPGIWQGADCRIHPDAQLHAPIVLGKNVSIEPRRDHRRADRARQRLDRRGAGARCIARSLWERRATSARTSSLSGCTIADRNIIKERVTISEGAVDRPRLHDRQRRGDQRPNIKLWPDKCGVLRRRSSRCR